MTKFIDITVVGFNAQYTRRAHGFNVDTQILLKVPRENMMTIRLKTDDAVNISTFLAAEGWDAAKIKMHMNALKTLTDDKVAPHHKNRWISEQRAASLS